MRCRRRGRSIGSSSTTLPKRWRSPKLHIANIGWRAAPPATPVWPLIQPPRSASTGTRCLRGSRSRDQGALDPRERGSHTQGCVRVSVSFCERRAVLGKRSDRVHQWRLTQQQLLSDCFQSSLYADLARIAATGYAICRSAGAVWGAVGSRNEMSQQMVSIAPEPIRQAVSPPAW